MVKKSNLRCAKAENSPHKISPAHTKMSTAKGIMITSSVAIPSIVEHDLLTFQFAHFGDETKPEHWFIDAETALNFRPDMEPEYDELGYYDDGVRRTLTDEQIAMFRHSEVQELLKECRLQREEQEFQTASSMVDLPTADEPQQVSPISPASSLEAELVDVSKLHSLHPPITKRQASPSTHSDTSKSTNSSAKRRRKEIPYDQRKKRNWEQYIQGEDGKHGSITQRRLAREMDEQRGQDVVMDYGDDEGPKPKTQQMNGTNGRRPPVSYEDL